MIADSKKCPVNKKFNNRLKDYTKVAKICNSCIYKIECEKEIINKIKELSILKTMRNI
jgi:hypothetical protein